MSIFAICSAKQCLFIHWYEVLRDDDNTLYSEYLKQKRKIPFRKIKYPTISCLPAAGFYFKELCDHLPHDSDQLDSEFVQP